MIRSRVAILALALTIDAPAAAEPDPIYRDSMVICPDSTRVRLTVEPGSNRPSVDQLRTLCETAGAATGKQPPRIYPGKFGGGMLICPDRSVRQRLDWSEDANWPLSRLYALCGVADPNAARTATQSATTSATTPATTPSATPAVPRSAQLSPAQIRERFNTGLVTPAPKPLDRLSPETLDRMLRPPRPLFTFKPAEFDAVVKSCIGAAAAANVAPGPARTLCSCTTRSVQFSVTRAQYDAYLDWQVWKTSWRRHIWTVAKPAGVEERMAAGASACRSG